MLELSMPAAKAAAVNLRFFLKERGFDVPLSVSQEALARTRGAASFQVLLAAEQMVKTPSLATTAQDVVFNLLVQVQYEDLLNDALDEYQLGSSSMCIEDKLGAVCVEQNKEYPFLLNGGPKVTVTQMPQSFGEEVFCITVKTQVLSSNDLKVAALRNIRRAWGPQYAGDLLLSDKELLIELLCKSNTRASPADLGFAYLEEPSSV